jgi:exodeoxyribonuclease VII small subunit
MMAKKRSSTRVKDKQDEFDFETSLAEVEQIVAKLESGELGLSESLEQYETGIKQLKRCHALLDAAEQRVSLLSGFDAEGNPIAPPMEEIEARDGRGKSPKKTRGQSSAAANAAEGVNDALSGGRRSPDSVDDVPGLF